MDDRPFRNTRIAFSVLAVAATLIGLGVQLLSGHPIWAAILMLSGVFYLLFEGNFNSWSVANIPGPLRMVFTVIIVCFLLGLYRQPIGNFLGGHERSATFCGGIPLNCGVANS